MRSGLRAAIIAGAVTAAGLTGGTASADHGHAEITSDGQCIIHPGFGAGVPDFNPSPYTATSTDSRLSFNKDGVAQRVKCSFAGLFPAPGITTSYNMECEY